MRNYRDFILYTDHVEGACLDQKGRPDLISLRVFDSPMGAGEHDEAVAAADRDQSDSWRSELVSREIRPDRFEKVAQQLGELILPPDPRQLYQSSLGLIWLNEEERQRVRPRLIPELAFLPWEYALVKLHDGEITDEDFWALNFRISDVRHEAIAVTAAPSGASPSRRVIIAMAGSKPYTTYPSLDLEGVQRAIKSELNVVAGNHPDGEVCSGPVQNDPEEERLLLFQP